VGAAGEGGARAGGTGSEREGDRDAVERLPAGVEDARAQGTPVTAARGCNPCCAAGGELGREVAERVADGTAAGDGGGGGEATRGAVGDKQRRGRPPGSVRGRRRLVAAADEAGAGRILRLRQREGDGDALERLPVLVDYSSLQRPRVAGADGRRLRCVG